MDNPVGLTFTGDGERILCGTFFVHPEAGRRDGLIHAIYGGVYGKQHDDVLAGHIKTGDLMPVMTHMGSAAPCSVRVVSDTSPHCRNPNPGKGRSDSTNRPCLAR